jgi:hypothetical protein
MYDVAVGQDKAIGCKDETRPCTTKLLRGAIGRSGLPLETLPDIDVDHGRAHLLGCLDHSLRIGIEKQII